MARTIGKTAIRRVQEIAAAESRREIFGAAERAERAISRLHPEYYLIWESAWAEIQRVIDDEVFKVINGR